MNQEKIGKFILELRKSNNMTQQDLAIKLGVTDRAISKWENGRGLPDLSLLIPLCEILNISINELLSGEKLDDNLYKTKLEENIVNVIDYSDGKIRKIKKSYLIILCSILIFIILIVSTFLIDINRMKNNKPVIFSTWGYDYTPAIDLDESEIEESIYDFLTIKADEEFKHSQNGKSFASIKIYLLDEKDSCYNVYAWVVEGKFYEENNEIKEESASSIPYKFVVEKIKDKYIVTNYEIPRDGSYYKVDMKRIFPSDVLKDINNVYNDGTIEKLLMNIDRQKKLYFHK